MVLCISHDALRTPCRDFTKQCILAFELVDVISQQPRHPVGRSLGPTGLHVMHLVAKHPLERGPGSSPTSSSKKWAMSV
jgi:hypothetical protein